MHMICLIGPPGVGKFTVGEALAQALGWPLWHNHLVVDAALALFPFGSEPFVALRHRLWLEGISAAAQAQRSFVFTLAPEPSLPLDFLAAVEEALAPHGGRLHVVELVAEKAVLLERVQAPGRARWGKLQDPQRWQQLAQAGAFAWRGPAPHHRLDLSQLSPAEAAGQLQGALGLPKA